MSTFREEVFSLDPSTQHGRRGLSQAPDLKYGLKIVQAAEPGKYAIGRLTFVTLEEQSSVKKVLVRK